VTITIDGTSHEAPEGELLIRVAQDLGTYIPRFCWHERLSPVGMCRLCLVEVEGMRGLQISCATPVADGMVVHTRSDVVRAAQEGVLELFLTNHPLDCPVCDRGGECPLQDQALAFGPGESRFVEEKRHWPKPIPISELVLLDRERCIQCGRCTRFAAEIAGEPLIDFGGRGAHTEVIAFPERPYHSYFSGNIVQLCPVGALTATPYRFKARPWDLVEVETTCTACSFGCRGALQAGDDRLVRFLGVDVEATNHGWLCDKGRFSYEAVGAPGRLTHPMVRRDGQLVEVSWPEALDAAAEGIRRVLDLHGPEAVAVLGGARGTNEDAYCWARLAKEVVGTDHVDAQLDDGLPAAAVLGWPPARIADLDRARAIVCLGPDVTEELPVLGLRLRRAVVDLGVPLAELSPQPGRLARHAAAVVRHLPGEAAAGAARIAEALGGREVPPELAGLAERVAGRDGPVVVIAGRRLAERPDDVVAAASALVERCDARVLPALRRGNVRGAIEMGLSPGVLPGGIPLDAGAALPWARRPSAPGLEAAGILAAGRDGRLGALVLLGADPLGDVPDRALAEAGLAGAGFVVAVDAFATTSNARADVLLPVAVWGEKAGTVTNVEGRWQPLRRLVTPPGTAMPDWRIAMELAARLGAEIDLATEAEVLAEIASAGYGDALGAVGDAPDGVLPDPPPGRSAFAARLGVPTGGGPPRDAYALRLVTPRHLYDAGIGVQASPSLARLAPTTATAGFAPRDRDRLGVRDGDRVRIRSAVGGLTLPVRTEAGVAEGTVVVPWGLEGTDGPGVLISAGAPVTEVTVDVVPEAR
jgi:NADH-quinone oxidoreductase subunit G